MYSSPSLCPTNHRLSACRVESVFLLNVDQMLLAAANKAHLVACKVSPANMVCSHRDIAS